MDKVNKCLNECLEIISAFKGNRSSNSLKAILTKYLTGEPKERTKYEKTKYSQGSW